MASKRFRSDKERDPIAELARLIAQADSHEESAPSDNRLRKKTASDCHDEIRELPPAPQLAVDLNEDDQASEHDMHYADDQASDLNGDLSIAREYQDSEVPGYAVEEQREGEVPHYPVEDEHEDNEVWRGRRRSLTLVMAIFGLALIGSACAVGYRNMVAGPASPMLQPNIKPNNEANTVPSVSKAQAASTGNPREIGPTTTGSIDNMVSGEDRPAVVGQSKSASGLSPPAGVSAPPAAAAAVPAVPRAAATAPAPRPTIATAPSRARQSGGAKDTVASSREHLAAIPVGPANSDTVAASAVASGYAVQVTSERSESRAQAVFRALQAKYPNQLGAHQPIIRRADLGAAGIYYRALVGPFASAEKATKLCSGLKAAGGDCIIQKNP